MRCKARQISDQMNCTTCGLVWDVSDPDPPACAPKTQRTSSAAERSKEEVGRMLADAED